MTIFTAVCNFSPENILTRKTSPWLKQRFWQLDTVDLSQNRPEDEKLHNWGDGFEWKTNELGGKQTEAAVWM